MGIISAAIRVAANTKRRVSASGPVMNLRRKVYFGSPYVHERMLSDAVRNAAYHAAIQKHVNAGDVVLDAGTGTGVLAFMAAARNPRKVYALDHSKPMIDYARRVAAENGITNVEFVASPAERFNPPEMVDVIIQEQMGSMLFAERMLDTIIHLRDRVLKPGGRILPARFEFYLEPVQLRAEDRVPFINEIRVHGLKFPHMSSSPPPSYLYRTAHQDEVDYLLCDPQPVWTCDLRTVNLGEAPKRLAVRKPVIRSGQLDAVCSYFRASFDEEISISTAPGGAQTHWTLRLYRVPARQYEAGDVFEMAVEVPELADQVGWKWTVGAGRS